MWFAGRGGTWKGEPARVVPGGGQAGCHGICKTPFVTRPHKNPSNAALDWQPCATGTPCLPVVGNYALQNRDTTSPTLRPLPTLLQPALASKRSRGRAGRSTPGVYLHPDSVGSGFLGRVFGVESLDSVESRLPWVFG